MIMMIMTVVSVDQRPGWDERVKNPLLLWCPLEELLIFQQAMAVMAGATRFVR